MTTFLNLNISQPLVDALATHQITTPTPIQEAAIPPALLGKDILASAQTGTGKTLAFLLPLVTHLLNNKDETALVLIPTRELAQQVKSALLQVLGKNPPFAHTVIIGGEPIFKQFESLKKRPRLIIGTPGRINDHLKRQSLSLSKTTFLALDEVDRMLDMGFSIQLEEIFKHIPTTPQTLMFSATMPAQIVKLAQKYLKSPERISIGSTTQPMAKITQEVIHTSESDKFSHLLSELNTREGSVIVFVKTKRGAEDLAYKLRKSDHRASAIHGDLQQRKRERVIESFRKCDDRIMVATDIAARGLDIPHVQHVVNYHLPQCPEDYIHRIGRTGRAGATGAALSLVSPGERMQWKSIDSLMTTGKSTGEPFARKNKPKSFSRFDPASKPKSFGRRNEKTREFEDREKSSSHSTERKPRDFRFNDNKPKSFGDDFSKPKSFGERAKPRSFSEQRSKETEDSFGKPKSFGERAKPRSFSERSKETEDSFGKPKSFGNKPRAPREFEASEGKKRRFEGEPGKPKTFRGKSEKTHGSERENSKPRSFADNKGLTRERPNNKSPIRSFSTKRFSGKA